MNHHRAAALLGWVSLSSACSAENVVVDPPVGQVDQAAPSSTNGPPGYRQTTGAPMKQQITITSDWGHVTADLVDNAATRRLVQMLPLTIKMRDHLRQEKTGRLPSPLPEMPRQTEFSAGTLGIWGNDDFVLYYDSGRVPPPGIMVIGRVTGDVAVFNAPGPITIRLAHAD